MEQFLKDYTNTIVAVGIGIMLITIGVSVLLVIEARNKSYGRYIKDRDERHKN